MGISNDAQSEVDEFGAASAELKMFPWDSGYIRWEADSRYALEERIGSLEQQVYALRKRNAELESERRWIPVSERLPEDGQEALICYDGNIYLTTYEAQTAYLDDHNNIVICRGFRVEANDFLFAEGREFPSHWMYAPKLPVSEEVQK